MKPGNESAYPGHHLGEDRNFINSCEGMTIRQEFASRFLQALLSNARIKEVYTEANIFQIEEGKEIKDLYDIALSHADNLLAREAETRG